MTEGQPQPTQKDRGFKMPFRRESGKTPEQKMVQEKLQLATRRNSLRLLGKMALGDTNTQTARDFKQDEGLLRFVKSNGTLTQQADTSLHNACSEYRRKHGIPIDQWASRVTNEMFSKKKEIKHNTFLKQIGFEEKITLGTGREEAQKKVEIFLKGTFKEKYLEKDGTANLANELTKNLQGKTGKQLTKEIKRVRTILDQNNDFLGWIFGEQARETFKATIELRIADKLEAFDYQKNIEADPVNNTFYTEPLRNTPVNEPAILDYLEQGATLPVRTTSGNREPVLSQATNPPPDQQLPGGQHQPPATHPQAIQDWLEPILPVANQESVLSPRVPGFPDPSIVVQQEAPP